MVVVLKFAVGPLFFFSIFFCSSPSLFSFKPDSSGRGGGGGVITTE